MSAGETTEGNAVRMDSAFVFVSDSNSSSTLFRTGMQDAGIGRGSRGSSPGLVLSEIVFRVPRLERAGDDKDGR